MSRVSATLNRANVAKVFESMEEDKLRKVLISREICYEQDAYA